MWYRLLNIFFFVFHTIITLFNCTGRIFPVTRKWHLLRLGYHDQSRSYIHFLLLKLTGVNVDPHLVEQITLLAFLLSFVISIWLNIRDWRKGHNIK